MGKLLINVWKNDPSHKMNWPVVDWLVVNYRYRFPRLVCVDRLLGYSSQAFVKLIATFQTLTIAHVLRESAVWLQSMGDLLAASGLPVAGLTFALKPGIGNQRGYASILGYRSITASYRVCTGQRILRDFSTARIITTFATPTIGHSPVAMSLK